MNGLAAAERLNDRRGPVEPIEQDEDDGFDHVPAYQRVITDAAVEATIERIAAAGVSDDELGDPVPRGPLMHALARQWVADRLLIPTEIAVRFWQHAKAITPASHVPAPVRGCSQCGMSFPCKNGYGFSHCKNHAGAA